MALPNPLPDNPTKWEGWKSYHSPNPYERLCLSYESSPSEEQIEDHCRQLLVWWQKKLPLKNQPSNPLAQMLRGGLDDAPKYLAEARSELLNADSRARVDTELKIRLKESAVAEFHKFLEFSLTDGQFTEEEETNLCNVGARAGLLAEEMKSIIDAALLRRGIERRSNAGVAPETRPPVGRNEVATAAAAARTPAEEFMRLLRLSNLNGDDEMTDDQRDALCNMGESLGLTGGEAEDLIDAYLEQGAPGGASTKSPEIAVPTRKPVVVPKPVRPKEVVAEAATIDLSPGRRAREIATYLPFRSSIGTEMILVPSGAFNMGSDSPAAAPNEQPVSRVLLNAFYISRFPVTNGEYEDFDSTHRSKRAPWADGQHPVIYVSSVDAENFCRWLSARDRKRYRLPTEAEWEYAARGNDGRTYPWGERLDRGDVTNFADRRTAFAWREEQIDDGYEATSPVGSYPRGASPFGAEDMSGNVWEWCLDYFEAYKGKERVNPRGPTSGAKRVHRGGSWKSRATSLRATARNFNLPGYASNDIGFRIICECE